MNAAHAASPSPMAARKAHRARESGSAGRAIWKGEIRIGSSRISVKLLSAVRDRDVHFHQLDRRSRRRVKQMMVDPATGGEVESAETRKGLEIEPGTFVVLDEDELD